MNINNKSKKVVFELLSNCNLNCKHCFYKILNQFTPSNILSKNEFFCLIDKFSKNNVNKLVLTGGEPTLHPSFAKISEYAMTKIPKVSICTNGFISSSKLENIVVDLDFCRYTVSIDSHMDKVHNEFRGKNGALQKTIIFLRKLKSKNKNISVHITIHPSNINHIEKTIIFSKEFSSDIVVSSIYHKPNTESAMDKAHIKKLKKFKERYIDTDIILVGFEPFCMNENCLDQKNIFMINRKGELIECYWKENGGKIIQKY